MLQFPPLSRLSLTGVLFVTYATQIEPSAEPFFLPFGQVLIKQPASGLFARQLLPLVIALILAVAPFDSVVPDGEDCLSIE